MSREDLDRLDDDDDELNGFADELLLTLNAGFKETAPGALRWALGSYAARNPYHAPRRPKVLTNSSYRVVRDTQGRILARIDGEPDFSVSVTDDLKRARTRRNPLTGRPWLTHEYVDVTVGQQPVIVCPECRQESTLNVAAIRDSLRRALM